MKVLNKFVSTDPHRAVLQKVKWCMDMLAATDGRCLVMRKRQPDDENFEEYTGLKKFINMQANETKFNVQKLNNELLKHKTKQLMTTPPDCSVCGGDGFVMWEYKDYQNEFDCPGCNGNGLEGRPRPTGEKVISRRSNVMFGKMAVGGEYLRRLLDGCTEFSCGVIEEEHCIAGKFINENKLYHFVLMQVRLDGHDLKPIFHAGDFILSADQEATEVKS